MKVDPAERSLPVQRAEMERPTAAPRNDAGRRPGDRVDPLFAAVNKRVFAIHGRQPQGAIVAAGNERIAMIGQRGGQHAALMDVSQPDLATKTLRPDRAGACGNQQPLARKRDERGRRIERDHAS